jgi:hypothetical protein
MERWNVTEPKLSHLWHPLMHCYLDVTGHSLGNFCAKHLLAEATATRTDFDNVGCNRSLDKALRGGLTSKALNAIMLGRMTENKKTYIVDDFIAKVRSHRAFQTGAWVQRIDDLEAILQALFVSDDERAIEIFDEIQRVIERKHMAMEKRIAIIQGILRAGRIYLS